MFSLKMICAFLLAATTAQSTVHVHSLSRGIHNGPRRLKRAPQLDIPSDINDVPALVLSSVSSTDSSTDSSFSTASSQTSIVSSTEEMSSEWARATESPSSTSFSSSIDIPSSTSSPTSSPASTKPTCDSSGNLIDFLGNTIADLFGQCSPAINQGIDTQASISVTSSASSSSMPAPTPQPTCNSSGNLVDFLGNIIVDLLGQCTPLVPSSTPVSSSTLAESSTVASSTNSAPSVPTCDASGNVVDLLGNIVKGVLGACTPPELSGASVGQGSESLSSTKSIPSSTPSAGSPKPTCNSSGNLIDFLGNTIVDLLGQCVPASSTTASTPTLSSASTSSATPTPVCGPNGNLLDFLGNVIKDLTGQCTPPTPSSTSTSATVTPTCGPSGNLIDFLGNVIKDLTGQCTPPSPSSTSPPGSSTSSAAKPNPTCDSNGNLIDFLGNVLKDVSGQCNPTSISSSRTVLGPVSSSVSSTISQIIFPTLSSTFAPDNSSSTSIDSGASSVPTEAIASSTSAASISIDSIWLNVPSSALLQASVPSSTALPTLTNPDQAASTISLIPTQSPIPDAPLPSGIPAQILPPANLAADPNADHTGLTLVSILFDDSLPWTLETSNSQAPGQMFVYFPMTIANALDIPVSKVQTLYLQAYKPTSYTGPADIAHLGTMYLAYLPTENVTNLAAQIKAHSSPFYTASTGLAKELAVHVDATFAINSVTDPNSGSSSAAAVAAASDNASLTRQNAIIGVVSALAGLALIMLAYLVYKSYLRKRELAHRRLTDPMIAGVRPNRDFDVDSVGAPRRRSFYFAEDSLGGAPATAPRATSVGSDESYTYHFSPEQMRERRHVIPGTISAPQLQQSSMNW